MDNNNNFNKDYQLFLKYGYDKEKVNMNKVQNMLDDIRDITDEDFLDIDNLRERIKNNPSMMLNYKISQYFSKDIELCLYVLNEYAENHQFDESILKEIGIMGDDEIKGSFLHYNLFSDRQTIIDNNRKAILSYKLRTTLKKKDDDSKNKKFKI